MEMAAPPTSISIEQDQFSCSVCLDVLRDPVTIPCGHSYCLDCVEDYWNRNNKRNSNKGHYSCPQCRQVFSPRPALSRNTVLAEVVRQFQGSVALLRAKAEEAKCGLCAAGRKARAVKSCLVCLESYCDAHLRAHEGRFRGNKAHKLITALPQLRDKLCPHHDKLMRLYCRTDQQCVCSQCERDAHKGHDTVSVVDERAGQQKKLEEASSKSVQRLKDAEKELRYVVRYIKHSTDAAVEESDRIFSKLIRAIEKQRADAREQILAQEKTAVSQAEELLEKIEKEAAELKRREIELEKLSQTPDHIEFLQKCTSLHFPTRTVDVPFPDALPYFMYKTIRGSLADLRDRLEQASEKELVRVADKVTSLKETCQSTPVKTPKVKHVDISYSVEPSTRSDFQQYYNDITLDPYTANAYLSLSNGRRVVTTQSAPHPYPEHPDRFSNWAQVLCRAGTAGRCYWEVEWAGGGGVSIGVCYKSMDRKGGGSDCKLGHNAKSWSLDCSLSACSFQHNKETVAVAGPCSSRIGVYLDYRGGTLSFYNVCDDNTMVLLHRVKSTFTQPLYPGFWVGLGSTLKLCSYKGPG